MQRLRVFVVHKQMQFILSRSDFFYQTCVWPSNICKQGVWTFFVVLPWCRQLQMFHFAVWFMASNQPLPATTDWWMWWWSLLAWNSSFIARAGRKPPAHHGNNRENCNTRIKKKWLVFIFRHHPHQSVTHFIVKTDTFFTKCKRDWSLRRLLIKEQYFALW